jgi:hypothetical protein
MWVKGSCCTPPPSPPYSEADFKLQLSKDDSHWPPSSLNALTVLVASHFLRRVE